MVLSVKELSSWTQTYAYFDELAETLHKTAPVPGLGQGAFVVRDGSVVVRKDWRSFWWIFPGCTEKSGRRRILATR